MLLICPNCHQYFKVNDSLPDLVKNFDCVTCDTVDWIAQFMATPVYETDIYALYETRDGWYADAGDNGYEWFDYPDIRFDNDRITHTMRKIVSAAIIFNHIITCRRYSGFFIKSLHCRFCLEITNMGILHAGRDIKIRTQRRIGFQPVLVIRLEPVDLTIFKNKVTHCSDFFIVVFKTVDLIIFCQTAS